jgi:hypothetical protein
MVFLARRGLMAVGLSAAAVAALPRFAEANPVPPSGALRFNIVRKGKPFGQYAVTFATADKVLTVTTDVAMSEKIANVMVFDYHHHCVETWRDGRFSELHATTIRDRKKTDEVHAVRGDYEIKITTDKGPDIAPVKAAPLTHWNMATLTGPLFNPQDGRMLDLKAQQLGRDPVLLASGASLGAAHWALHGADQIEEWYDDAGLWAGLKGLLPDKSVMEYRRV